MTKPNPARAMFVQAIRLGWPVLESELAFAGVAGQSEALRRGEGPRASWSSWRCAIDALDPELNAFGAVYADRARDGRGAADRRRAAGEDPPLLGVPVAVKDELDLAGEVTSRGTGAFTARAADEPRSYGDCGPPAPWWSARRRCRSWACGRSRSR